MKCTLSIRNLPCDLTSGETSTFEYFKEVEMNNFHLIVIEVGQSIFENRISANVRLNATVFCP